VAHVQTLYSYPLGLALIDNYYPLTWYQPRFSSLPYSHCLPLPYSRRRRSVPGARTASLPSHGWRAAPSPPPSLPSPPGRGPPPLAGALPPPLLVARPVVSPPPVGATRALPLLRLSWVGAPPLLAVRAVPPPPWGPRGPCWAPPAPPHRRRCLPCRCAGAGGRGVGPIPASPALGPAWGAGPTTAGGALTTAGTSSALAAVADAVPAGIAGPEDPPPLIPLSLVVDPHPVVDQPPPPPVAHQGYTVAALTAARAEHAAR
jgi:hypothetical protein